MKLLIKVIGDGAFFSQLMQITITITITQVFPGDRGRCLFLPTDADEGGLH